MEDGQHLGNITAESVDNPIVAHDDFSNGGSRTSGTIRPERGCCSSRLTEAMIN
jgi:hypothetical protein